MLLSVPLRFMWLFVTGKLKIVTSLSVSPLVSLGVSGVIGVFGVLGFKLMSSSVEVDSLPREALLYLLLVPGLLLLLRLQMLLLLLPPARYLTGS